MRTTVNRCTRVQVEPTLRSGPAVAIVMSGAVTTPSGRTLEKTYMRTTVRLPTALCLASLVLGVSRADAKDALQAAVSIPTGQPVPLMAENGNGYTPGTYAVGTIILNYTYVGTSFPAGAFAAFNLDLKVYDASSKNEPAYPVMLS